MTAGLPAHGRVDCTICHGGGSCDFDRTRTEADRWRITNNPLAWGNSEPEVVVLGFSKGPTQAGALASQPHDNIAYKGGRTNLAKILHHVGLLPAPDPKLVDEAISDRDGRFHFASLVRCTVEWFDEASGEWLGTGGGMLDRFLATEFGKRVATDCSTQFLRNLPPRTKVVLMLGMGSKGNYVKACRGLFEAARPGEWRAINQVAYTDRSITVVHTEHFQSQGPLIPNWLRGERHERGRLGLLSRAAVLDGLEGRH